MKALFAMLALTLAGLGAGRVMPPPQPPTTQDQGPDVVVLDQVAGCYGAVRFDHRLHVGMASRKDGCKYCHHDLADEMKGGETQALRPCRTCHEPTTAVVRSEHTGLRGAYHRQCLSCHKDWTSENACGFCHTSSAALRTSPGRARSPHTMNQTRSSAQSMYVYQTGHKTIPVVTFHHSDHAERFGLQCADCHGGNSCGQCHGPKAERPVVNRQQSCYTCHSESRCVTCHDLGERGKFDHGARTRWYLRPGHASLACEACHEAGQMPQRPTSDACRVCHAQRWGDFLFDHSRTGVLLEGDHEYFECLDCHRGGEQSMLASCSACHPERSVAGPRRVGRWLGFERSDSGRFERGALHTSH